MPRIEIELTSARGDGTWTWRAAGALQPKGVLDGAILYEGAKVGDVVRAEAEFEVDGITVTGVLAPREKRADPTRLEILGSGHEPPPVTTTLHSRPEGDRGDRRPRRDRDGRREGGERRDRRPGGDGRPPRTDERPRDRQGPPRERQGPPRERQGPPRARTPRPEPPPPPPPRPKARKLQPERRHRDAALTSLPPEQQPVAEQVLRGGVPAVRQAVDQENERAAAEGRPLVKADALVALAEELLPRLRAAEWLDRAEAAMKDVATVSLRDLRSLVSSADAAVRDDEGRAAAASLREALERRATEERTAWVDEVTRALDENRVVRALRISGRAPEPGASFPGELATRLAEVTSAAMTADTGSDRWMALLDAAAASPVRRRIQPAGRPETPPDELTAAVRRLAPRLPGVAAAFGIEAPAAEGRPQRRPAGPGRARQDRRPRPPRPPRPPARGAPPASAPVEAPQVPEAPAAVEEHVPVEEQTPPAPPLPRPEEPTLASAVAEAVAHVDEDDPTRP